MEDPDGRVARLKELSECYLAEVANMERAQAELELIKAQMQEVQGPGLDRFDIDLGDIVVIVGSRAKSRKVNVVALQRAGVKKEEFSTITPSIAAFNAMCERRGWGEAEASAYLIIDPEKVQRVSVRKKSEENES
jgi:hypothetical protein